MRVFLGLETGSAEGEFFSAAKYLACLSGGVPVKRGNLHITLKYLGTIQSVSEINDITEAMDRVCHTQKNFYLQIDCHAKIPSHAMACAWIAGETDELNYLRLDMEDELARLGFPRDKRKYLPHVTLVKKTRDKWELGDTRMQRLPFLVSRLTLYESVYQNGELYYIPLYTSEFAG